jgi:hypothetical protein
MQKKQVLIFISLFSLLTTLGCGLVTNNSRSQPTPKPYVLEDLFIDEAAFPAGWTRAEGFRRACVAAPLDSGCKSYDDLSISYYSTQGGYAYEDIYVYGTADDSAGDFERMRERVYSGNDFTTPWVTPDELLYESSVASQSHFACHTYDGDLHCQFLGQYDEFIVLFFTHKEYFTHKEVISYDDLKQVLEAIDQRMAEQLDN